MWTSTADSLPLPGRKVFFAAGPMIYRASFQDWFVRPSDDGPLWLSVSGRRVTHWMPAECCAQGMPLPPAPSSLPTPRTP